jgi:hypothetical protein
MINDQIKIGQYFKSTQSKNHTYQVTRIEGTKVTLKLQNSHLQHEVEIHIKDINSCFTQNVQS